MEKLYFQEIQQFRQSWLWVILIGLDLLMVALILWFSVFEPGELDVAAITILGITSLLMIAMSIAFFHVGLVTEIRNDGIFYRFKPFQRKFKTIRMDELQSVDVKKYNPVMEYGGWGIRIGRKKRGSAYNVSGNIGILFIYTSGKKILLGTHKPESVRKALQRLTDEGTLSVSENTSKEYKIVQ